MSDQERATRPCPYCKEVIMAEALRCKHCQATGPPARPAPHGVCPHCKESINPEAIRCQHCRANLAPGVPAGWPQEYCGEGPAARRSFRRLHTARAGVQQATLLKMLHADPEPREWYCPPTIIAPAPDGSGLGIWC